MEALTFVVEEMLKFREEKLPVGFAAGEWGQSDVVGADALDGCIVLLTKWAKGAGRRKTT